MKWICAYVCEINNLGFQINLQYMIQFRNIKISSSTFTIVLYPYLYRHKKYIYNVWYTNVYVICLYDILLQVFHCANAGILQL